MCSSQAKHLPSLSNSLIFTISKFQIMKKTYIIPKALIVELVSCQMMAESAPVSEDPLDPGLFETKEHAATGGGKSIWDEEW